MTPTQAVDLIQDITQTTRAQYHAVIHQQPDALWAGIQHIQEQWHVLYQLQGSWPDWPPEIQQTLATQLRSCYTELTALRDALQWRIAADDGAAAGPAIRTM